MYVAWASLPSLCPTTSLTASIQDGTTASKTFVHTPSIIEAEEAEEIGVEHLLRDIRDVAVGTLSTRVTNQLQSLQGLHLRLRDIQAYLQKVLDGQLPVNHAILGNLQDVFNLLPNLSTPKSGARSKTGSNRRRRRQPRRRARMAPRKARRRKAAQPAAILRRVAETRKRKGPRTRRNRLDRAKPSYE